jgi:hypothetical protein
MIGPRPSLLHVGPNDPGLDKDGAIINIHMRRFLHLNVEELQFSCVRGINSDNKEILEIHVTEM